MTKPNKTQQLLLILNSITKTGNISVTADSLFLAQPNVSKIIRNAEANLRVQLIDRSSRPLKLTSAGNYYVEQMQSIESQSQTMLANLSHFSNVQQQRLVIGVTQSLGNVILPRLLPGFHQAHPEIELVLEEYTTEIGEQALANHQVDVYFGVAPTAHPAIVINQIFTEGCSLILSTNDVMEGDGLMRATDLLRHRELIVEDDTSGFQRLVNSYLAKNNIHPWRTFTTANLLTASLLASKGLAPAIVPNSVVNHAAFIDSVSAISLDPQDITLTVTSQHLKNSSNVSVIKLLLDYAQQNLSHTV